MMAEHSPDVLCRITMNHRCAYCSPSCLSILGWQPEEMMLRFPAELLHPEDALDVPTARNLGDPSLSSEPSILRVRRKDGEYAWLEVNSSLMRDRVTRAPWQVLLSMRDVGKRRLAQQRLQALAMTDALTGLGNRRAFAQALEHEWGRARREKSEVSLLMLDVDNFKGVNDRYGHAVGDQCLCAIAATLSSVGRRSGDLAARYGGEEFALLLPATDAEGAARVAEQVRAAIEGLSLPHIQNRDHGYVVTVSVGAATAVLRPGSRSADFSSLLKAADSALYKAKQQGRNQVETALLTTELYS